MSRSISLPSKVELINLLQQSRARNEQVSITGMLLYKNNSYLQVLEGSLESIQTLFNSIQHDSRHFRIKTLIDCEPIDKRAFPEWFMGFQNLEDTGLNELNGYSNFLEPDYHPLKDQDTSVLALKLLHHFRQKS